jgi:hypothetical protein
MSFNPEALNKKSISTSTSTRVKPSRIIMVVEDYQTPSEGFHYAIGHKFDNIEEKLKIRLNTVDERCNDVPKVDREKIQSQYISGENTRDTIMDKSKNGIKLISFDDAVALSSQDGITEYRAHWGKTISTDPAAELMSGLAHIRLRPVENGSGQAYVEMVKGGGVATPDSIEKLIKDGLTIKDDQGRARDPFITMRVNYEGKIVNTLRLYPAVGTKKVFDQNLGRSKEVTVPLDGSETFNKLMSGEKYTSDFTNQQADTIRAVVAGMTGRDLPTFNSANAERDSNIYYGAQQGALKIELISFEKLDFGSDSRKTYLNDKKIRPQLQRYDIDITREGSNEVRTVSGFTDTVVAYHRHPDGEPYVVFATPVEMWPQTKALKDITLETLLPAEPVNTLSQEVDQDNDQAPEQAKSRNKKRAKPQEKELDVPEF